MAQTCRDSIHKTMLGIAHAMALRSTCSTKHAVGAVITRGWLDGHILSTGYNCNLPGQDHCDIVGCQLDDAGRCVRAVHAEQSAILQCAKYGVSTRGATLYCTLAPCLQCAKSIVMAGISTVIYEQSSSSAAVGTLVDSGLSVFRYDGPSDLLVSIRSDYDQ